jgi:hypothetical protein
MKRRPLVIIPALVLAVFFGWLLEDYFLTSGYAPSAYPGYSSPVISYTQVMLIKNADQAGQVLLFKVNEDPRFFRYDPAKHMIDEVPSTGWQESKEKELDCWEQSTYDGYSGPIYGSYLLGTKNSPDNTKTAVLSAYGPKYSGLSWPGLGSTETIHGSRYLEIRSLANNERMRRPAKIDINIWIEQPRICWSEGGHYVVVYNQDKDDTATFSVVDVPSN